MRSSVWSAFSSQSTTLLSVVTSILVARYVTPDELGRYALASTIAALVGAGSSLQAGGYYVIADDPSPRLLRTGLSLELALSTALWALVTLGACIYGLDSGDWSFAALVVGACAVLILNPFNSLRAWYDRRLSYRVPSTVLIVVSIVSMVVKVALVIAGLGAWALVIGDLVLSGLYGLAMLIMIPDGRGFAFDRALARRQVAFGVPALGIGLLGMGALRAPELIIAATLGTRTLGFYFLAARIPAQLYQFGRALTWVLFPAFSRANPAQLAHGFRNVTYFSALMFIVPLAVVLPFATPLIVWVYGARWEPAAVPFAILFLTIAIRFVVWHYGNLLKSQNRLRPVLWMSVYQLGWTVVCCTAGAELGGLVGAVCGILVVELVLILPKLKLVRSVIEFHPFPVLAPGLLALAGALVVAYGLRAVVPVPIAIALATVSASIITIVTAYATNREVTATVLGSILPNRRAPRSTA